MLIIPVEDWRFGRPILESTQYVLSEGLRIEGGSDVEVDPVVNPAVSPGVNPVVNPGVNPGVNLSVNRVVFLSE